MNLRRWTNRSKLSAGHLNEEVDALNSLLTQPDALVRKLGEGGRDRRFDLIIGKTTNTGPNGEADGTNEVYWVTPQYILPASAVDDPLTFNDEFPIQAGEGDTLPDTIAVTNLPEWLDGTHNLPVGTPVMVLPVYERTAKPKIRYVMSAGGGGTSSGNLTTIILTGTWPGNALYQCNPVSSLLLTVPTTIADVDESYFTPANAVTGTNYVAINLAEVGLTEGHLLDTDGTNPRMFLAQSLGEQSTGGPPLRTYLTFWGVQLKFDCPVL
jgi:hypothetical protein